MELDNIKIFEKHVKDTCLNNNIIYKVSNTKSIKYPTGNFRVAGYFEANNPAMLIYARKHPLWLSILVHESCHMDQFLENTRLWNSSNNSFIIDEWLKGKIKYSNDDVMDQIDIIQRLELDCEKRSVKKIKKWNLPIDVDTYIQRANCYIWFYTWLKETRKWCKPNNSPYSVKEIYSKAPKKFLSDYNVIPKKIRKLFEEFDV
jgi:hypothetical protein